MPDVNDLAGVRTIAHAHSRLDDHEQRLIRTEVRQEEFTRRLEKLEHVPEDVSELKGDVKTILAKLEGTEKAANAGSRGTALFLDLLKALVLLVIGAAIRGGIGG